MRVERLVLDSAFAAQLAADGLEVDGVQIGANGRGAITLRPIVPECICPHLWQGDDACPWCSTEEDEDR